MNHLSRYHRTARLLGAVAAGLGLVVLSATTSLASAPTEVPLNPVPPASYACSPIGNGTRCVSDTSVALDPGASGIECGAGASSFEVYDQATRRVRAERWYDSDGNLVKRVRDNLFSDSRLFNPATGAAVPYNQHDTDTDVLAVPGDLDSRTMYSEESFVAAAPGQGAVLVNKGRSVYTATGEVISRTGRRDFDAYFGGDASVMAGLCAALGG